MKIQLDFDKKIAILCSIANILEFIEFIENFIPNYEDWELETGVNTYVNWSNPYIYNGVDILGKNPYTGIEGAICSTAQELTGILNVEVSDTFSH